MRLDHLHVLARVDVGKAACHVSNNMVLNLAMKCFLIALERQNVVATTVNDLFGNLPLATGGVNRHHGVGHIEMVEKLWNCRNFVGFLRCRQLAQADAATHRPCTDEKQRPQIPTTVMGPSQRLAVDRDVILKGLAGFRIGDFTQPGDPHLKAVLKCLRLEQCQQPTKSVMRRNLRTQF